jgi:signal transduction histidine kinase
VSAVEEVKTDSRLRSLVAAGMALTSEPSLDALLERLVALAADLTGARYAALGVIDATGSQLERFVTYGIDPAVEEAIGWRPQGRGILGVLIHEAMPLRLEDIAQDRRSVGFPKGHPPMRSFLGVPILLRGVTYGNLYLTEKAGGEAFSDEDEELVTLLAGQAAIAVENVRLYEAATRWSERLESLNEIGNALATETELDVLLDLIARRLRELLGARLVTVLLPSGSDELRFAATAGEGSEHLRGETLSQSESKSGRVLAEGRSARVDSVLDDPEVDPIVMRHLSARAGLWVPLLAGGRSIGVLVAHDKLGRSDCRFSDEDLRVAETFASRAAVAVNLSERVARDVLRRVVAAQELERKRLARELHDETGQALASIMLGLRSLERQSDPEEARATVSSLRELAANTLSDVRRLAVELRPKALDDFGLAAALERLTETWSTRTGIAATLAAHLGDEELSNDVATALYRIVQESLTGIVKFAGAQHVNIVITRDNGEVVTLIEDDGEDFLAMSASDRDEIDGMRERVRLLDGRLTVERAEGVGSTIVVKVPIR